MFKSGHVLGKDVGFIEESLWDRCLEDVFQYVCFWVDNKETAEDLTLIILKKAFCPGFPGRWDKEKFSVKLFTFARNFVLGDHLRQNKPTMTQMGVTVKTFYPPDKAGIRDWHELQEGLSHLTLQDREIIALKFSSKLSNRCIAEILGISETSIGTELAKAITKLNEFLAGQVNFRQSS